MLVDDGSTDGTYEEVIDRVRPTCALHVVRQKNSGLSHGRNVGIAQARGEIILFMDDDVVATPTLIAAHLRFHGTHEGTICRGGVIDVQTLDDLPPPKYSWRHYSGAYFWTTNVSVSRALLQEVGGFDERFMEYGWEDLELGFRLRRAGVPSLLARDALVYHYKPQLPDAQHERLSRQARAQARTARKFLEKHPHWRVALATGQLRPLLWWSSVARRLGWMAMLERVIQERRRNSGGSALRRWAIGRLARAVYYEELTKVARP